MEEYSFCEMPFSALHIDAVGNAYCCCSCWCRSFSIGNIFNEPLSSFWNGKKAQIFRKQFIDNNFPICQLDTCIPSAGVKFKPTIIADAFPTNIVLSYDVVCNTQCIFCRENNQLSDWQSKKLEMFDKNIDKWIPDVFVNAERVLMQGIGEAFASAHSRKVMKKIAEYRPSIKFDVISNGILFDEKNLIELGLIDKLGYVAFSIHAVNKDTYDKLIIGGNYERVMKNIEFAYDLYKQGKIEKFEFRFVINSINYKEMVAYAELAKKYSASVVFLKLIDTPNNKFSFDNINVLDPKHPEYNNFIDVLKHPIFKEEFCSINDGLFELKKVINYSRIQKKIRSFFGFFKPKNK